MSVIKEFRDSDVLWAVRQLRTAARQPLGLQQRQQHQQRQQRQQRQRRDLGDTGSIVVGSPVCNCTYQKATLAVFVGLLTVSIIDLGVRLWRGRVNNV